MGMSQWWAEIRHRFFCRGLCIGHLYRRMGPYGYDEWHTYRGR